MSPGELLSNAGNGAITPRFCDIRAVQRPVRWLMGWTRYSLVGGGRDAKDAVLALGQ